VEVVNDTIKHNNYYIPFKELFEASRGVGVVSFSPDKDGVFRREKLLFSYQDNFFPSLSLAPILDQSRDRKVILKEGSLEIRDETSLIRIPLTKKGEYFVNMYGLYNAFSISGVILSMFKIEKGELDNQNTSIATNTPGVYLHASMCGNIISGDFLNFTGPAVNLFAILMPMLCPSHTSVLLREGKSER
jgi:adenylate cyclase